MSWHEDLVKLLGYGLCRVLPIDRVSTFGARRGRYSRMTQQQLDERVRSNLSKLDWPVDHTALTTQLRQASGRAALEMLMADRIAKAGRIHWLSNPKFEAVVAQKESLVFVTTHMANLGDLTGAAIVARLPEYRMGFVTRQIASPVDKWIATRCRLQTLGQRNGWVLEGERALGRQMVRELQRPPACMLLHIDEARHHQVFVPSFGRPIPKDTNLIQAVRLARLAGAHIVPLVLMREGDDSMRFTVQVLDVIDIKGGTVDDVSVVDASVVNHVDQLMTEVVRQHPDQWLQMYHLRM